MKALTLVATMACLLALGGCATIFGGTKQQLSVDSNVEGAEVFFNGEPIGTTPLVAEVPRGEQGTLTVSKPGYESYEVALTAKTNGLIWLNIVSGGAFGISTDYSSGAAYEYAPDAFMASLQEEGASAREIEIWRRREGVRAFILFNSDAVIAELGDGRGEHVDTLVELTGLAPAEREEAVSRWKEAYAVAETAADFANFVVAGIN